MAVLTKLYVRLYHMSHMPQKSSSPPIPVYADLEGNVQMFIEHLKSSLGLGHSVKVILNQKELEDKKSH